MTDPSTDQINLGASQLRVCAIGRGTNRWNYTSETDRELESTFKLAHDLASTSSTCTKFTFRFRPSRSKRGWMRGQMQCKPD